MVLLARLCTVGGVTGARDQQGQDLTVGQKCLSYGNDNFSLKQFSLINTRRNMQMLMCFFHSEFIFLNFVYWQG